MSAARDEVAEFAALLAELKERTGRSYGSLARRLGMNTSTLHRYCAGEAVPQDFAPVERLAEFCGALPEERLELHRRWLLASAARQRPRAEEAPDGAAAVSEAAEALGAQEGAAGEAAEGAAEKTAEEAAEAAAEEPRVVELPAEDGPEGAPAGSLRPARRRRRTAVLAALAVVLLATLGTLSALPADDPSSPGAAGSPAPPRTTAPAAAHPSSTPTPSGSGSASPSASPSRAPGTGSPSPGPGKPSPPATGTAPSGGAGAAVPLTWTADAQTWALGCGHDYVVAKPPAQVPPPPAPQDAGPWAATQGAVHGRETNVEISVQGRSSTAVVLTALRVRVVGRTAPVAGNVYAMDQGCGGAITPRHFAVDLDKDRPIARSVAGNDAGAPIPAVRMPYRVSATDPEVLLVTARTEGCACSWYLELDWSSQGRTGTVRIDDHGRPFRTSGIVGLPRYAYDTDGAQRGWVPVTD
ncbi:helix-turn-helix transcriptional regulator [Streptomyces sp. A012304]|uniref:helix-turn-helix domain-containing protein n=1 Tax=Streptomyces sp. A012304 TaxID=375446 RepID=UPI0022327FED|nr:helix-turn-helix transcriptional regulator [Streptomyces sp. A012304]GKQ36168.1 hypothetical protein ALMP_27110 [Streptomyces sp. A012304]